MQNQKHVLVLEDDLASHVVLEHVFTTVNPDIDMRVFEDSDHLLTHLERPESRVPDLIFLDLNVPKKNGKVVLASIKAHTKYCNVPTLIFTTSENPHEIQECYALGCSGFFVKDFSLEVFEKRLRDIFHYWFQVVQLPPK